jgi:4'-phosphopantetheinyl transferase
MPLPLAAGGIAVWQLDLQQPEPVVAALGDVLSPDERARAARFVFARDRRRFVVTRACLRALLARHGGVPASAIRFAYGAHGKPSWPDAAGGGVHFSVSHSEEVALIALARHVALGVDVEAVRPLDDLAGIAARFFTAAEAATILGVPAHQRELAFFLCWTRKEAFSKARGDGLTLSLDRYRVTCAPGEAARVVEVDGSAGEGAAWTVHDLRPAPGFVGAVVLRTAAIPLTLEKVDLHRDVLPCLHADTAKGDA